MIRRNVWGILALLASAAHAQWLNFPAPGTPRLKDGKPNLSAPAPKQAGKPDLSGVWKVVPTPYAEMVAMFGSNLFDLSVPGDDLHTFSKYALNVLADFKPEDAPIRPEAFAILQRNGRNSGTANPTSRCLPATIPFNALLPFAVKIVQTPQLTLMLYEADGMFRQIHTDGRKQTVDPQPSWLGYSVAQWTGDTLVVDTIGLNDKGWIDGFGHPRSEGMRVTERFRRRDFGHLDIEVTMDDPKMYTKPFSIKFAMALLPDTDVLETVCNENEKDLTHFPKN